MTTTIVDVALAANVSRATASRALAGYGRVRPATREKFSLWRPRSVTSPTA